MGPTQRKSAVLSELGETAVVAVRVQTRLPLDDLYSVMPDAIPPLSRSTLHRALQRSVGCAVYSLRGIELQPDGVRHLPHPPRDKVKRFKAYEIGYFHLNNCELRTAQGRAHLVAAGGRTSKLVLARLYRKATRLAAQALLEVLIRTVPHKIHTIAQRSAGGMPGRAGLGSPTTACRSPTWPAVSSRSWCTRSQEPCWANGIEHRLTKPSFLDERPSRANRAHDQDATVHAFYATI